MPQQRRRTRRYKARKQQQAPQQSVQQLPASLDIITSDNQEELERRSLTPPGGNRQVGGGINRMRAAASDDLTEELWQSHSEDFTFDLDNDFDAVDLLQEHPEENARMRREAEKETTAVLFKPVVAPVTEAPELNGVTVLPRPVQPVIDLQPQTEVCEEPLSDDDTLGIEPFVDAEAAPRVREPITSITEQVELPVQPYRGRLLLVLVFMLGACIGYGAATWQPMLSYYQDVWQRFAPAGQSAQAADLDDSAPAINE